MKKITIYAIHSNKLNYKEEFYKSLLLSEECQKHNLILPLTEKYQNVYAKELVENSDIVIVNLTNATFSVYLETKWALKMNKKILFLLKEKGKCSFLFNKYKKISQMYYNYEDETEKINEFIKENIDDILAQDENGLINLGNLS